MSVHRAQKRGGRDNYLCFAEMVSLNVAHCRCLASRDRAEGLEMLVDPLIVEPFWVIAGCHLEQMLVQGSINFCPNATFEGARPRKQHVPRVHHILVWQGGTRAVRPSGIPGSELCDLDDRQ